MHIRRSQADLAEKVGCDTKTIGRWESGDRFPRPYHRQSLCEIFGKNAEELGLLKGEPRNIKPLSPPGHRLTIPEASLFPMSTTASSQSLLLKESITVKLRQYWAWGVSGKRS